MRNHIDEAYLLALVFLLCQQCRLGLILGNSQFAGTARYMQRFGLGRQPASALRARCASDSVM